jgi:peptidoglycan/LPS O-acetylase OafA/YrhL
VARALLERPAVVDVTAPAGPSPGREFRHAVGLDGIRALAVAAVVAYHIGTTGGGVTMPGGFIGVDVFFVLSGYLITSLLIVEFRNTRRISIGQFYLRRARRLLPALFAVLLTVGVVGAFWLPQMAARLRGDLLAALGYATNWWLIVQNSSYFGAGGDRPDLLTHLWSLAVEEQYYLIWPLLLIIFSLFRASRKVMIFSILAGVAASTIAGVLLYDPYSDPSRVYYGTDTRALAPLLGSALAIFAQPWLHRTALPAVRRLGLDLIGLAGLGGLVWVALRLDDKNSLLYEGGFLVVAALAALLVGAAGHPASWLGKLLGLQPLRWLGERSYAIYLWHWPVCVLTRPGVDLRLTGWADTVLRIGIVIVLAEASYWLIERPIRRYGFLGRLRSGRRARPAPAAAPVTAFAAVATPAGAMSPPLAPMVPSQRTPGQVYGHKRRPGRMAPLRIALLGVLLVGGGSIVAVQLASDVAHVPVTGGPLDTTPDIDLGQLPTPSPSPTPTPSATSNTPTPMTPFPKGATVAWFGDSQGMTLLLNRPADLGKYINALDETIEGCGILLGKVASRTGEKRNLTSDCGNWESVWKSRVTKVKPDVAVVMIGAWDVFDLTLDSGTLTFASPAWDANFLTQLDAGVQILRAANAQVELALLPCYRPVPRSAGYWPERGDDTRTRHVNTLLVQEALRFPDTVHTLQPPSQFCTNPTIAKSLSYRWDGVHYYKPGAALYFKAVLPQLVKL